jgi:predicted O-methyltransferase YrrM
MLDNGKVEFIVPTDMEKTVMNELDSSYLKISEMSNEEREFLTATILRARPPKLLEIGVSGGGSSVIMLNAIKNFPESKLYSIDLMLYWYKDPSKKAGFIVDNYPELKTKWKIFTGGLALNFIDEIGADIDFCLIDTAHSNPGEILDILMVIPYLKDDAVVVFHDVKLHTYSYGKKQCITNDLIMSALFGTKLIQGNYAGDKFPNIGGIKFDTKTKEHIFEIFNLLTLKWAYMPDKKQVNCIIEFFKKHYNTYYIKYLVNVFEYQSVVLFFDKYHIFKKIIKSIFGQKNIYKIRRLLQK